MINKIVGDYLDSNVFIIEKDNNVIIIDSGANLDKISPFVKNKKVVGVFLTHGHFDHALFCLEYSKIFNCPIYADSNISKTLADAQANYSKNGEKILDYSNFILLDGDGHLNLKNFSIDYLYCPGHSICSKCYLIDKNLFSGDVLFEKSFGRYDLKYSDSKQLLNSLIKIENINYETLYSGHGNSSNKQAQTKNMVVFKKFLSRYNEKLQ